MKKTGAAIHFAPKMILEEKDARSVCLSSLERERCRNAVTQNTAMIAKTTPASRYHNQAVKPAFPAIVGM